MKKFILSFAIGLSFVVLPSKASASIVDDFIRWIIPAPLKPQVVVQAIQTRGVGGVLITADPNIVSGDTERTFYLPALTKRSFHIENGGAVDLFLNKNPALGYEAIPQTVPGDVPAALALNVGEERTVIISNASSTANVNLSKTDLSIISTNIIQQQTSVFVTNASAKAAAAAGSPVASITLDFTLNNATNNDIYVNRLINPQSFVDLVPISGAITTIKFIESSTKSIAGDSGSVYVVPAGKNRAFELTGIIDNTLGTPGIKTVAISQIHYSNSKTLTPVQALSGPVLLRNLATSVEISRKIIATPSVLATRTPTPSITSTPSPVITKAPTPVVTATPSSQPTPFETTSPYETPLSLSGLIISDATTSIGSPIMENEEVVGYPITFSFSAKASGKTVYLSKSPSVAFTFTNTGFGSVAPTVNSISANPSIRTGDGGSYYVMPAGTIRSYQAFGVIKSDGLTKPNSILTMQISKINYGFKASILNEAFVSTSIKAIVKLSPRTYTPAPTPSETATPSSSPSSSPTNSPSSSPSPSSTSLIALCYAVPTNPYTGDLVTWQVMQTGGSGTPSYTWSGSDSLSGSNYMVSKRYTNSGRKDALVSVVSGGQSVTTTCNVNVTLAPSPSYISTPTDTGTPTPTGSNVSFQGNNRGFVANILSATGEWLDSFFER